MTFLKIKHDNKTFDVLLFSPEVKQLSSNGTFCIGTQQD
jgi:hypothetical protein